MLIKIHIGNSDNVKWLNHGKNSFHLNNNVIDVWRVSVGASQHLIGYFTSLLLPDEIARANKYLRAPDKERFTIGRGALRYILGRYLNIVPLSIEFGLGDNKKPYLLNPQGTNLNYNTSHSEDWILIAVAKQEVGADVEFINASFNYTEIIQDIFNADEINFIKQNPSAHDFFKLWTRKEALIKATGKGLDEDLKAIPCLDDSHPAEGKIIGAQADMLITSFKLGEEYFASIASGILNSEFKFWDIRFA